MPVPMVTVRAPRTAQINNDAAREREGARWGARVGPDGVNGGIATASSSNRLDGVHAAPLSRRRGGRRTGSPTATAAPQLGQK